MGLFEIKCPICRGAIWIDPASGKVVDHKSVDQQKINFEDFLKSRNKGVAWDEKMKKAKEEDEKRRAEIEKKFNVVKTEKPEKQEKNPLDNPLAWD